LRLNDPELVAREYASERGLEGRRAAYRFGEGPDPREMAFAAVAEVLPRRVLEVGPGPGELAERIQRELHASVVAVDISERMVELTRARGVEAIVGDVQQLPFPDASFDCAVAAWMLYHVPAVDRGIAELARVLRPGGRLVAVANGADHWQGLSELVGFEGHQACFAAENGEELLRRQFAQVERRDATGWIVFPDRAEAQAFVDATISLRGELPPLAGPLRVRRSPYVFVAEKAA
jgi:ubiquinone/menaquinone biosynthesis C-methylase UbiE